MRQHLFDTCSFMTLIKKANPKITADCLRASSVLDLTFYEIGNAIWKESSLTKFVSQIDSETLQTMTQTLLAETNRIVSEAEAFQKILEIAKKEKLTFYDSSYIYHAKDRGLILVTEDKELKTKATKYVDVQTIETLLSP
jgi:predicted nucleic acid-binding protein